MKKVIYYPNFGIILCVLELFKRPSTNNLNFFTFLNDNSQKLLKKEMAITLAQYKLESCNLCHFVRIGIFHMTPY
jgi:hypothetical protein